MELSALTGTYPVMDGERAAGTLEVSSQGGYLRFRASCRASGRELMRLRIGSGGGEADCNFFLHSDHGGVIIY